MKRYGTAALCFALLQPQERGVLRHADIRIAVADSDAVVEATYVVVGAAEIALLAVPIAARTPQVELASMGARQLVLEDRGTSLTLRAYRPPDSAAIRLRYRLEGRLARIPLFVPSAPTAPPGGAVVIRITGLSPGRVATGTVPRFSREADGTMEARLEHVPSLVAVVADPAELPVPRISAWLVMAVVVGGTGAWVIRLARGRGRPAPEP
jgi:hypothetical protein